MEAIEARLLLGDASLGAGEQRQAVVAYDEALTAAVRHGSSLRAADALDGYAAALRQHDAALASAASTTALRVRLHHRAARRPRPWLIVPPPRRTPIPAGWLVNGLATEQAAKALSDVQTVDPTEQHSPISSLSPSELAVARLVATGQTNRDIGAVLHISRRTVETHIAHAFHKLDIRTRSHLASLVTSAAIDR
jgi:DNA-binding CsgD family transcriptional regulator